MSNWQGKSKRKATSSRLKKRSKKRKFEIGNPPTETIIGDKKKKVIRGRSGIKKVRLKKIDEANVTDPQTGKTEKTKILKLIENPANVDYTRRRILTKGAIVETELGKARITSRINQNGIVNAILLYE
ncbi:MAG: 30S ribosomal protein S8e [Candidatus Lokiarchaeota archaeon]|nr:30S ribosomal protein S8e [Candidatus Lokiarchaeota archaeon]